MPLHNIRCGLQFRLRRETSFKISCDADLISILKSKNRPNDLRNIITQTQPVSIRRCYRLEIDRMWSRASVSISLSWQAQYIRSIVMNFAAGNATARSQRSVFRWHWTSTNMDLEWLRQRWERPSQDGQLAAGAVGCSRTMIPTNSQTTVFPSTDWSAKAVVKSERFNLLADALKSRLFIKLATMGLLKTWAWHKSSQLRYHSFTLKPSDATLRGIGFRFDFRLQHFDSNLLVCWALRFHACA